MTDIEKNWRAYIQAWSEVDSKKQLVLIENALDEKSSYVDFLTPEILEGIAAIHEYIKQTQKAVPGLNLKIKSFSYHHGSSLASWDMCDKNGGTLSSGHSFAKYNLEGRITQTTAFFDQN